MNLAVNIKNSDLIPISVMLKLYEKGFRVVKFRINIEDK